MIYLFKVYLFFEILIKKYLVPCFKEIVDLALAKAEREDPSNLALILYRKRAENDDEAVIEANEKRTKAYMCITETMELLYIVANSKEPVTGATLNSATILYPSAEVIRKLPPMTAKKELDEMIQQVFKSEDELAHVHIFKFLLNHNMSNILIEVCFIKNFKLFF